MEIPEITGIYKVMAKDEINAPKEWFLRIDYSNATSDYDFYVYNIDPVAATEDNGLFCKSTASLNRMGTQLNLSKYIYSGDKRLVNYSNQKNDLIVRIESQNTNMTIAEEWGTINNTDSTELSRYHDTQIVPMSPDVFNISVADNQAGELHTHLHGELKPFITSLTVTGSINGSDVRLIRELLKDGSLKHLNLENAYIVEGGDSYYNDYQTQDNTIGDYMFYYLDNLTSIVLPSQLKEIRSSAFSLCKNLNALKLPEGIKVIPSSAFIYCDKLSNLVIPSTVEIINDYCVSGCKSLKRIDCYIKNIEEVKPKAYSSGDLRAFKDIPNDCEWHVGKGLKQKYMSQSWWKESWSIIDDLPSTVIKGDANDDNEVDVADVTAIISYIMQQPQEFFNYEASDMDEDGEIDVTDLTLVINLIMQPETSSSRCTKNKDILSDAMLDMKTNDNICSIQLASPEDYISAQFDIIVPQWVNITSVRLNDNDIQHHQIQVKQIEDCRYRILIFSLFNSSFENIGVDWLNINLDRGNSLIIENVLLTTTAYEKQHAIVSANHASSISNIRQESSFSKVMMNGITKGGAITSKGVYIVNGKKVIVK